MLPRAVLFLAIFSLIILENRRTFSFRSKADFKKKYKELQDEKLSTTDVLVGKAMDLMYSNRTIMSLIAKELWNVGSTAIDKLVKTKEVHDKYQKQKDERTDRY